MKKIVEKLQSGVLRAQNKAMLAMAGVTEKREGGDHLLEVLGVIIIAVVLLVYFRGELVNLFKNAMNNTTNQVNTLFGTP